MDMMFEFYEDGEVSMESCSTNSIEDYDYDQVDDEKSLDLSSLEERKVFWEAQQEVLHPVTIMPFASPNGYSLPDIPSGEHTYIDVVDKNTKKGEVRVVIELNFRAEFEMARASKEYNQLVDRLPKVFVGKAERLRTLIKIMRFAAKTCMREKKMHMGQWRKHKYMQSKWFGTCKRTMPTTTFSEGLTSRLQRPKASLLTFDFLEKLPSLHCIAVEVL
ncbi:hypothetical protein IFM89_019179, partial [Coptis chinensis]